MRHLDVPLPGDPHDLVETEVAPGRHPVFRFSVQPEIPRLDRRQEASLLVVLQRQRQVVVEIAADVPVIGRTHITLHLESLHFQARQVPRPIFPQIEIRAEIVMLQHRLLEHTVQRLVERLVDQAGDFILLLLIFPRADTLLMPSLA